MASTDARGQLRARRGDDGRPNSRGSRGRFWPAVLDAGEGGVFAERPGLFISPGKTFHPRGASERGQPWFHLGGGGCTLEQQRLNETITKGEHGVGRAGRRRTDIVPREKNPRACSPHHHCPCTGKMFHGRPRCQEPATLITPPPVSPTANSGTRDSTLPFPHPLLICQIRAGALSASSLPPECLDSSVRAPQCCYHLFMAKGKGLYERDPPPLLFPASPSASPALLFPPVAVCTPGASAAQPTTLDTAFTSLRPALTGTQMTIPAFNFAPPGRPRLRFFFHVWQCDPCMPPHRTHPLPQFSSMS